MSSDWCPRCSANMERDGKVLIVDKRGNKRNVPFLSCPVCGMTVVSERDMHGILV